MKTWKACGLAWLVMGALALACGRDAGEAGSDVARSSAEAATAADGAGADALRIVLPRPGWKVIDAGTLPSGPPLLDYGAVQLDGLVYVIGGRCFNCNNPTQVPVGSVLVYDPGANTWSTRASIPTPRWGLALTVLHGRIYAIGGSTGVPGAPDAVDGGGDSAAVEEYDPIADSWRARAPLPTARRHLTANVLGGRIFAAGGETGGYASGVGTYLDTVELYDPRAAAWAPGPSMTTPRARHGSTVAHGSLYALGGDAATLHRSTETVERYDPRAHRWSHVADVPGWTPGNPARTCATTWWNGRIYAFRYDPTGPALSTVELDPVTARLTPRAPAPSSVSGLDAAFRYGFSILVLPDLEFHPSVARYTPPLRF